MILEGINNYVEVLRQRHLLGLSRTTVINIGVQKNQKINEFDMVRVLLLMYYKPNRGFKLQKNAKFLLKVH